MAQWLAEEAALLAVDRLQADASNDPGEPQGPSEARSEHERIMAAARKGQLVT